MKDSFVFYRDWLNVMEQLPAEIQLELYQAVAQYALNGKAPTLSPMAKIAFGFIQQTLDRDEDKYHKTVVSSKVSGRMGNLKRWHKDLYQKVLKGALSLEDAEDIAQAMKKSPPDKKNRPPKNLSLNDNDNVNDNINVNDNVNDLYKQTNKQAGAHEENPEAEKQPLNAYEDFKGNLPALEAWFAKRWNDAKKHYKAGVIGKVAILGQSKLNLIDVAKTYTQREIDLAIKGVFIQKEIYPQFTLSPDKMLETDHFSKFYNAGLTNTQLYNENPQKGQKSSKKGVVRNVGDL